MTSRRLRLSFSFSSPLPQSLPPRPPPARWTLSSPRRGAGEESAECSSGTGSRTRCLHGRLQGEEGLRGVREPLPLHPGWLPGVMQVMSAFTRYIFNSNSTSIMCSGPCRGASGTQQLAQFHRKGVHRMGATRSGTVSKPRRLRATDTNPYAKTPPRCSNTTAGARTSLVLRSLNSTGLRPLPPTPKRKTMPSAIERDACRFRQKISKQKMKP